MAVPEVTIAATEYFSSVCGSKRQLHPGVLHYGAVELLRHGGRGGYHILAVGKFFCGLYHHGKIIADLRLTRARQDRNDRTIVGYPLPLEKMLLRGMWASECSISFTVGFPTYCALSE